MSADLVSQPAWNPLIEPIIRPSERSSIIRCTAVPSGSGSRLSAASQSSSRSGSEGAPGGRASCSALAATSRTRSTSARVNSRSSSRALVIEGEGNDGTAGTLAHKQNRENPDRRSGRGQRAPPGGPGQPAPVVELHVDRVVERGGHRLGADGAPRGSR